MRQPNTPLPSRLVSFESIPQRRRPNSKLPRLWARQERENYVSSRSSLVARRLLALAIPIDKLNVAVRALMEIGDLPLDSSTRSHHRNRVLRALHGQLPLSGGRYRTKRSPLTRIAVEAGNGGPV